MKRAAADKQGSMTIRIYGLVFDRQRCGVAGRPVNLKPPENRPGVAYRHSFRRHILDDCLSVCFPINAFGIDNSGMSPQTWCCTSASLEIVSLAGTSPVACQCTSMQSMPYQSIRSRLRESWFLELHITRICCVSRRRVRRPTICYCFSFEVVGGVHVPVFC